MNTSRTASMSRNHERRIAEALGGRPQPGSGNRLHHQGDVDHPRLYVEAKATAKESIRLKTEWLATAAGRAFMHGKKPVVALAFDTLLGPQKDWVAIPLEFFVELLKREEKR